MAAATEDSESSNMKSFTDDEAMEVSENEDNKFKLKDLKVTDLKVELEKRALDKSGVKSVLIERLKNSLLEAGEDPEEFTFKIQSDSKSPMKKKQIPDSETNGGIDTKTADIKMNKINTTDEVTENISNEIVTNDEVTGNISNEIDKNEEVVEDISLQMNENDVTENISMEVKETSVCSEDKNINEVTLQISIDEEEAQLNEDEGIEISKVSDNESDIKLEETNTPNCNASAEENAESASEEMSNVESSPNKTQKAGNEDIKDKKNVKTALTSKTSEVTTAVSPKVLKVIGKNDKIKNASVLAKSLWITGLPNTTRAADLKSLFSKQGRVLSVKIVKSTKQTPVKCYGFVTMATSKDATKAIQNLHRTELNGRTISVERTQSDPSALLKKSESKQVMITTKKVVAKKEVSKVTESGKSTSEPKVAVKTETKITETKPSVEPTKVKEEKVKSSEKPKSKERDQKSRERKDRDSSRKPSVRKTQTHRPRSSTVNERPRFGGVRRTFGTRPFLGRSRFGSESFRPRQEISVYDRMREERVRRDRIRDRERREADRRRLEELNHHKFIERKQREEAYRLEREKETLRIERELLERERAEMLKMEREKQRLERERLEREREELRRVAELGRAVSTTKRPFARTTREADLFLDYRKKASPRFEERSTFPGEKLRLDATASTRYEFSARDRPNFNRHEFERRPTERFATSKVVVPATRADFGDRDSRREVTIRSREERPAFDRSDFKDRDNRRSFQAPRERSSTSRRESSRDEWKHDRRVQERVVTPSSSSVQRRTYY